MKIRENMTVYNCDHCNKRYLNKSAAEKHEKYCTGNIANWAICSGCSFLEEKRDYIDGTEEAIDYRYFYCSKKKQRMHPLKAVRKGTVDKYPLHFADSQLMPNSCELFKDINI